MLIGAVLVPAPASAQSPADEALFIRLVNEERARSGLAPLVQNTELTQLSRGWASAQRDGACGEGVFICHANPISAGVTQPWQKLGENVGTGPEIEAVMRAFIASPSHHRNIVDPEFTHIGVGVVWDGARLYTTHRFMALSSPAPTTTTAPPTTTTAAPTTTVAPTTVAPAPTTTPTTTAAPATTTAPSTAAPSVAAPTTVSPTESASETTTTLPAVEAEPPQALPFVADVPATSDRADESADTDDQAMDRVTVLLSSLNALESTR